MSNFVNWLVAFMIVLAILTVGVAVQEWLEWRKVRRNGKPDR